MERPVPRERAEATVDDLRDAGSRTVKIADTQETAGWWKIAGGAGGGGAVAAQQLGILDPDNLQSVVDTGQKYRDLAHSAKDLAEPALPLLKTSPFLAVVAVVACVALIAFGVQDIRLARRIKQYRLEDHQSGVHAGASED